MNEHILSARIAELRRANGFTQEQLATRLGVTYQAVSKWENSQSCPDVMLLPQLADCFGVSLDSLFGRENPAPVPVPAPAAETPEREEQAQRSQLPWPDDDTLYAVLFKGHTPLTDEPLAYTGERERIRFVYSGPALHVHSHFSVTCEDCTISGGIDADGDVSCDGGVEGGVKAGGDVRCDDVEGSVTAGGDVSCDGVEGGVKAGGDVTCDSVEGNVTAGGDVTCDNVEGNVTAGSNVYCSEGGRSSRPRVTVTYHDGEKQQEFHADGGDFENAAKEFDLNLSSLSSSIQGFVDDLTSRFKDKHR